MATIISTKTSGVGGLEVTGDATGILQLASNNGTTAVTVDASQNVGIGTASPSNKFHVSVSSQADADGIIRAENTTASTVNASLTAKNYYGTSQFMQWENNGLRIGSRITTNGGAGNVIFTTGSDTERMRIDSSGYVTKPYQVGFKAGRGTSAQSVANNTACIFNTTAAAGGFNTGNAYNTSTGNFTAPIAGRYIFNTSVIFEGVANGTNFSDITMQINGNVACYGLRQVYVTNTTGSSGFMVDKLDAILNLSAGDVVAIINNTGSTKTLHANSGFSIFCGYLLG